MIWQEISEFGCADLAGVSVYFLVCQFVVPNVLQVSLHCAALDCYMSILQAVRRKALQVYPVWEMKQEEDSAILFWGHGSLGGGN